MAATLGIMRMALAQAVWWTSGRSAFQKRLIDQPAMRAVLADLALEYEAAAAMTMRVARAFDARDEAGRAFARLAVALGKFRLTKRCPDFVYECHGGSGYVEESPMPRLYREAPLNAIWEGSGNVIALDVLRTLQREPAALEGFADEIAAARGADPRLDRAARELLETLSAGAVPEHQARRVVERMALLLQAALLVRHAPAAVADAFCASRLAGEGGRVWGALPDGVDLEAIVARQTDGLGAA
jgi:putative acyl-CoA dehydrogenase